MSLYISSGAFKGVRHLDELIPLCREYGIQRVELASGLRADEGFSEVIAGEEGMDFLLHNYFPAPEEAFVLNLADAEEQNRIRSVEFCRSALGACSLAGVPFYSVHAGFVASLRPEDLGRPDRQQIEVTADDYERALSFFRDSVRVLAKEAERLGVRLLIENNVHAVSGPGISHLLMVSPEDISDFFDADTHPSVGLLLDVAHLKVSSIHRGFDPVEAIKQISPWVSALHLSENDGRRDTNDLCLPNSWFWKPLNRYCPGNIETVLEAYGLTRDEMIDQMELISRKLACVA